jgi:hypothetical protein
LKNSSWELRSGRPRSLAEVGYCVQVAHRLGYIDDQSLAELEKDINGVGAPLAGLLRSTKTDMTLLCLFLIGVGVLVAWFAA